MSIKSKLEKLEKSINILLIPKRIIQKIGIMPACFVPDAASAEEKQAMINTTKDEYFNKLASELDATPEKAKEAYKKTIRHAEPIIFNVDKVPNRTIL